MLLSCATAVGAAGASGTLDTPFDRDLLALTEFSGVPTWFDIDDPSGGCPAPPF